jgi:hypothetical protein
MAVVEFSPEPRQRILAFRATPNTGATESAESS